MSRPPQGVKERTGATKKRGRGITKKDMLKGDHSNKYTGIWEAVIAGQTEKVKSIINSASGKAFNSKQLGATPIFLAAQHNRLEILRFMASSGGSVRFNPNIQCVWNYTALHIATQQGHIEAAKLLLTLFNANPNGRAERDITPLMIAASSGFPALASLLIDASQGTALQLQDSGGGTALTHALTQGKQITAKSILRIAFEKHWKMGVNLCDKDGFTALHYAVILERSEEQELDEASTSTSSKSILELLLDHGADVNAISHQVARDSQVQPQFMSKKRIQKPSPPAKQKAHGESDVYKGTPLHHALAHRREDTVMELLERCESMLDVTIAEARWRRLPLHLAAVSGMERAVRRLVEMTPFWMLNQKDSTNSTPLELAVQYGHEASALVLAKHSNIQSDKQSIAYILRKAEQTMGREAAEGLNEALGRYRARLRSALLVDKEDGKSDLCDLVFVIKGNDGEEVEIPCSRAVIYVRSEYWRKVLEEKENEARIQAAATGASSSLFADEDKVLKIHLGGEAKVDSFQIFLRYIYTDEVELTRGRVASEAEHHSFAYGMRTSNDGEEGEKELTDDDRLLIGAVLLLGEKYQLPRLVLLCKLKLRGGSFGQLVELGISLTSMATSLRSTFGKDMRSLVNNPKYADVVFSIGAEGSKVYAHKVVLVFRSDYFRALLSGSWQQPSFSDFGTQDPEEESAKPGVTEIAVMNVSLQVFLLLLEFCYTGDLEIGPENVVDVYELANEYMIPELKRRTETAIEAAINIENVCAIYQLAWVYGDKKLKDKAINVILHDERMVDLMREISTISENSGHAADSASTDAHQGSLAIDLYLEFLRRIGGFKISPRNPDANFSRHDPHDPENQARQTPLQWACSLSTGGSAVLVKWLLSDVPGRINQRDGEGRTPLHLAVSCPAFPDLAVIRALLFVAHTHYRSENGEEFVDAQTNTGDTALHMACRRGDKAVALQLIERKANVQIKNKAGDTPLQVINEAQEEFMFLKRAIAERQRITELHFFGKNRSPRWSENEGDLEITCGEEYAKPVRLKVQRVLMWARCPHLRLLVEDIEGVLDWMGVAGSAVQVILEWVYGNSVLQDKRSLLIKEEDTEETLRKIWDLAGACGLEDLEKICKTRSEAVPESDSPAAVCTYFLAGSCRFGHKCRSLHSLDKGVVPVRLEDQEEMWGGNPGRFAREMLEVWKSEKFSDVAFVFRSEEDGVEEVKAHSCVLAMRSERFKEVFSKMQGKIEMGEVEQMKGISKKSFEIAIKYVYSSLAELEAEENQRSLLEEVDKVAVVLGLAGLSVMARERLDEITGKKRIHAHGLNTVF